MATSRERLQIILEYLIEDEEKLTKAKNDLNDVGSESSKSSDRINMMRSSLRTLAVVAGTTTAALFALKKGFDFAEAGAQIQRLETSGQKLADQFGQSMPAIVNSISSASNATIDDMAAMQAANAAMALGVANTPEQFEKLTKASVALGRAQGRTALQSINDLTVGIGRQSKLILDNLGITYDANRVYSDYADSVGKAASALTDAEKKQALLNLALEQAQPLLAENGELIDDQAAQYEKLSANWKNLTDEWKKRGANIVKPVINRAGDMISAYDELDSALQRNMITEEEYNYLRRRVKFHLMDQSEITDFLSDRTEDFAVVAQIASKRLEDQRFAAEEARRAMMGATIPTEILQRKMEGLADSTDRAAKEMEDLAEPLEGLPKALQLSVDALRSDWEPAWAEAYNGPAAVLRTLELMQARMEAIARMKFAPVEIPVNITGNGAELMLAGKLFGGIASNVGTSNQQQFNSPDDDRLAEKLLGRFGELQ